VGGNSDFGSLTEATYLIMLSLTKPRHGYGIMQFVSEITNGRVNLGAGTMYGAINTLICKKWIIPNKNSNSDRKKEYILTESGFKILLIECERLKNTVQISQEILNEVSCND